MDYEKTIIDIIENHKQASLFSFHSFLLAHHPSCFPQKQRRNNLDRTNKTIMRISSAAVVSLILLSSLRKDVFGFQISSISNARKHSVTLYVASPETETEPVPYVVSRGDGSVGGGGVAMPKDIESQLVRPKVGAEMPKGRPSWFHVPAPSQGRKEIICKSKKTVSYMYVSWSHSFLSSYIHSRRLSIHSSQRISKQPYFAHRVRRSSVSQYWRMLEWRNRNNHAAGRYLVCWYTVLYLQYYNSVYVCEKYSHPFIHLSFVHLFQHAWLHVLCRQNRFQTTSTRSI